MRKHYSALLLTAGLATLAACASAQNPCEPNPCVSPPANSCDGRTANIYPPTGACTPAADQAICEYTPAT